MRIPNDLLWVLPINALYPHPIPAKVTFMWVSCDTRAPLSVGSSLQCTSFIPSRFIQGIFMWHTWGTMWSPCDTPATYLWILLPFKAPPHSFYSKWYSCNTHEVPCDAHVMPMWYPCPCNLSAVGSSLQCTSFLIQFIQDGIHVTCIRYHVMLMNMWSPCSLPAVGSFFQCPSSLIPFYSRWYSCDTHEVLCDAHATYLL